MMAIAFIANASNPDNGRGVGTHWTFNPYTQYNLTLTGVMYLDGESLQNNSWSEYLEIGAFCGNECRGSFTPNLLSLPFFQGYAYQMQIYSNVQSGEQITFRVWDHQAGEELEVSCTSPITFVADEGFGNLMTPFQLNFQTSFDITVSASPTQGGTVSGGGSYFPGETCTLTATPNAAYNFVNWTKNGVVVSTNSTYSFSVTENAAYVANFTLKTYNITVSANPTQGGTVSGGGTYTHGQTCTLTATPGSAYNFVSWTLNGNVVSTSASYSFTVTGAGVYVANFTLKTYNITVSANPTQGGTVSGSGTYTHGETCTLTATPGSAYNFVSWTLNGNVVSTNATYSFTVTGGGAYVANFTLKTYNITTSANPTEGGTVSGGGTYTHGSTCTLTADANEGYYFFNWTKNGGVVSTNSNYSFTVTEAGAYVANFAPNYHWDVNYHQFANNMSVTAIIKIDGVEQATNTLELGAFCGEECRGREKLVYVPLFDRYIVFLTLYGENGDVNTFRLYDHAVGAESDKVCAETITFVADDNIGQLDDPFVFNFGYLQSCDFLQGYNWWCTYLEQEYMDGLTMLQTSLGNNGITIRSQSSGYSDYYAGYGWYGSLSSITNEDSYRIITNASCTINLVGVIADPADHPITIGAGWNWIGYVLSYPLDVTTAFSGFQASAGDKLKSQQGYADYYPGYGWYGSLTTLTPSMGIMYYSASPQSITFTYPDNAKGGELKANLTPEDNHWVPNTYAYPDNMTIMAVVELDGLEIASGNYELAAFANGECRGSVKLVYAEPLQRYVAFLTVAGDEVANLNFALYDAATDKEYFAAEESLNFSVNTHVGTSDEPFVIRFRNTTGVNEFGTVMQVYPNPVVTGERFQIGLFDVADQDIRVEVVNALGAIVLVEDLNGSSLEMTAPTTPGLYTVRVIAKDKGIQYHKLVVK